MVDLSMIYNSWFFLQWFKVLSFFFTSEVSWVKLGCWEFLLKMYMLVEKRTNSHLHLRRSPGIRSWSLCVGKTTAFFSYFRACFRGTGSLNKLLEEPLVQYLPSRSFPFQKRNGWTLNSSFLIATKWSLSVALALWDFQSHLENLRSSWMEF